MLYQCSAQACGSMFNSKKKLLLHERTHDPKRKLKCYVCGGHFDIKSTLRNHMMTHDQVKPYVCSFEGCGIAFTQKPNLKRHERIHSGEKPFKCEFCDKGFASGSNLKQHLYTHESLENSNVYECIFSHCRREFKFHSSLKLHYKDKHYDQKFVEMSNGEVKVKENPIVQKAIKESSKVMY